MKDADLTALNDRELNLAYRHAKLERLTELKDRVLAEMGKRVAAEVTA